MVKIPEYHVLSFSHNNDNRCALVALVHGSRYHVAADPAHFRDRSKSGKKVRQEYGRLLSQVKAAEQGEDEAAGTAPLFVQQDEDEDDSSEPSTDSAVDVSTPEESDDDEQTSEPTRALERWMLSPLKDHFSKNNPKAKEMEQRNVEDWYQCTTYYFDLSISSGKLIAQQDECPPDSLTKRLESLVPSMPLPKYLTELNVPLIEATNVTILHESTDPAPIHPAVVEYDGKKYFLKTVDNAQHQPTKREIQVMHRIESEGLHNEIRVPLLRGLVHFSNAIDSKGKQSIMGFIMDPIDEPTPLTMMLDAEVPEKKRAKWAEESARMVDILHQHGIIWGDAKGDNFMVDSNDDLWIIDFGGSYTEGWIDPELKETEEGDDQGVRKVANGLRDPEQNTVQPDDEDQAETDDGGGDEADEADIEETREIRKAVNKRKISDADLDTVGNDEQIMPPPAKQRKKSSEDKQDSNGQEKRAQAKMPGKDNAKPKYCYCNEPESERMIGCDGENCAQQWFHFSCVGIEEAPSGKWFCEECENS